MCYISERWDRNFCYNQNFSLIVASTLFRGRWSVQIRRTNGSKKSWNCSGKNSFRWVFCSGWLKASPFLIVQSCGDYPRANPEEMPEAWWEWIALQGLPKTALLASISKKSQSCSLSFSAEVCQLIISSGYLWKTELLSFASMQQPVFFY